MRKFAENNVSLLLFLGFLIFYVVQIPYYTYKSDVIIFVLRSLENNPIFDYAYLHPTTLLYEDALPNYHLGHTLILWLVYQISPEVISKTILPAGILSAICGALVVLLTYLIWIKLCIKRRHSVLIAGFFGIVPIFWEHSLIGEIHTLQMFFILLFIYSFLKGRFILSSVSFLIANLVSPLSGLAFGLLYLKGLNKKNILHSFAVGFSALVIYILIFIYIDADLSKLITSTGKEESGRGFIYRLIILILLIALNFHFFIYYLVKGIKVSLTENKSLILTLIIASIPQIFKGLISSKFLIEYGSFQITLFWALSFFVGYYLATIKLKSLFFIFSLLFTVIITYTFLIYPHKEIGYQLSETGRWLNENKYNNLSVIGPWNVGVGIIFSRDGADLKYQNNNYYDHPEPNDTDLLKTGKRDLLVLKYKRNSLRKFLAELKITGLTLSEYNPKESIEIGKISKVYENNFVEVYYWQK
jgi:hypothetical protein